MGLNAENIQMVTALAAAMPQLSTGRGFHDSVVTEWRLYQFDDGITTEGGVSADGSVIPVGAYWSRVFKRKTELVN